MIDKIKQNQAIYEENTESMRNQIVNTSSNNHILADNSNIQQESSLLDPNALSMSSKANIGSNEMITKNLVNELINKENSRSRTSERVNSSCIVSKSHANLDTKSYDSNKEASIIQPAFDILVVTLSALEADIARNFKLVSDKLNLITKAYNNLKFDFDTNSDFITTFDKKIDSLETRLTYFSDRDDDIWKMAESLSAKIQIQGNKIDSLENKIHEVEMNRMANETSRAEILNTSMPDSKEVEGAIKMLHEAITELEGRISNTEEKTRRIENYTQRSNPEAAFERRCDQMENDIREELDKILEQLENAKVEVKSELAEDFINFEAIGSIEQNVKNLKANNSTILNR